MGGMSPSIRPALPVEPPSKGPLKRRWGKRRHRSARIVGHSENGETAGDRANRLVLSVNLLLTNKTGGYWEMTLGRRLKMTRPIQQLLEIDCSQNCSCRMPKGASGIHRLPQVR